MNETEILQIAVLVAAYISVAKGFGLTERWTHVASLFVAAIFVLVPNSIKEAMTLISIIGLTASGAYNYVKKQGDGKSG